MFFNKILLILLFTLLFHGFSHAQSVQNFEGRYKNLSGKVGQSSYQFFIDKKTSKMLFHGSFDFLFEAELNGNSDKNMVEFEKAKGKYSNNLKDGSWNYESALVELVFSGFSDFKPEFQSQGVLTLLDGRFKNGLAEGNWKESKLRLENDILGEEISLAEGQFKNGYLTGDFKYDEYLDSAQVRFSGRLSPEGFLDGKWSLSILSDENRVIEERQYKDGILIEISLYENDSLLFSHSNEDVIEKLELLSEQAANENEDQGIHFKISNQRFGLSFDDGYPKQHPFNERQQEYNDFYFKALDGFIDSTSLQFGFEGIQRMTGGNTARFEYVLPPNLNEITDEIDELVKDLSIIRRLVLDNRIFNLNQSKSDSLAFVFTYFKELKQHIDGITSLNELIQSDYFRFADPMNYFVVENPYLLDSIAVSYSYDGYEKVKSFNLFEHRQVDQLEPFKRVLTNVQDLRAKSVELKQYADAEMRKIVLQEEVESLEFEMLTLLERIDKTFQNPESKLEFSRESAEILTSIYQNAQTDLRFLMQEYLESESLSKKENLAKRNIDVFEELLNNFSRISEFSSFSLILSEAFYRYSPNPFMENMDLRTRIKRRIYQNGVERLLPHFLNELQELKRIQKINDYIEFLHRYKDYMVSLAQKEERETNKMERRLRGENSIETVIEILQLNELKP